MEDDPAEPEEVLPPQGQVQTVMAAHLLHRLAADLGIQLQVRQEIPRREMDDEKAEGRNTQQHRHHVEQAPYDVSVHLPYPLLLSGLHRWGSPTTGTGAPAAGMGSRRRCVTAPAI